MDSNETAFNFLYDQVDFIQNMIIFNLELS